MFFKTNHSIQNGFNFSRLMIQGEHSEITTSENTCLSSVLNVLNAELGAWKLTLDSVFVNNIIDYFIHVPQKILKNTVDQLYLMSTNWLLMVITSWLNAIQTHLSNHLVDWMTEIHFLMWTYYPYINCIFLHLSLVCELREHLNFVCSLYTL